VVGKVLKSLIIGASRGIGLEFVRQYRAAGWAVTATARGAEGWAALEGLGAKALKLDVLDAQSASGLAWQIDGEAFDVVVVNAGVFGPRTPPLGVPSLEEFNTVMQTNVLGPMRVIPQIVDALAPGAKLAVLSSRMGSIGLRESAGAELGFKGRFACPFRQSNLHRLSPRLGPHRHGRQRR
jgi:NAD(P)-dependent dehydrogenase (short-subunit alcohol dehydrogenase family)